MLFVLVVISGFILLVAYHVTAEFWYIYGYVVAQHFYGNANISVNKNKSLIITFLDGGSNIYIDGLGVRLLIKKLTKEGIINDN